MVPGRLQRRHTAGVLKAQVGQSVQLSDTRDDMPFVDPCEGQVHLSLGTMPVADILADVNKGAVGDTNLQRLLVVAPDRVLLLAEEQSLIEIR